MVIDITDGTTTVKSLSAAENITVTPDDRLELLKLIDGAAVQDGWDGTKNNEGDALALSTTFDPDGWAQVKAWWSNRKRVTVVLGDEILNNVLLVVKSYTYTQHFEDYKKVSLEIWRAK